MDPDETTQFIIRSLRQQRNRNDIIKSICERTGMNWEQAKHHIAQVEIEHHETIAAGQKPLLIAIACLTLLLGLALSLGMVIMTLTGWVIFLLRLPIPYLGNLVYFLIGVLITVGGAIGLRRNFKPNAT